MYSAKPLTFISPRLFSSRWTPPRTYVAPRPVNAKPDPDAPLPKKSKVTRADRCASAYHAYLLGEFVSYGLRVLGNSFDPYDEELLAVIEQDIIRFAPAAGRRVGVTFTTGRSTAQHVLNGQLSYEWLKRAARSAAAFAHEKFDQEYEKKNLPSRVKGGKNSKRRPVVTDPAALKPYLGLGINKQAALLKTSAANVRRLRAESPLYQGPVRPRVTAAERPRVTDPAALEPLFGWSVTEQAKVLRTSVKNVHRLRSESPLYTTGRYAAEAVSA